MSAPFRLYFIEKPARLSICQSQPKLLQIMRRQCCFPDLLLLFSFPSFYSTAFYCLVLPTFYCFVFLALYCLLPSFYFVLFSQLSYFLLRGGQHVCATQMPVSQLARLFVVTPPPLVRFCFWHGDHLEPMLCPQGDAGCHKAAREATSHHVMLITTAAAIVLVKEE